mgnify:CR=1 FL=1
MVKQEIENSQCVNGDKTAADWQQGNKQKVKRLALFTALWVVSTALLAFGPKFIWDFQTTLTIVAVFINLAMGGLMIFANRAHLHSLDEMQQRIQAEAMALSLGVGLVVGGCYEILEDVKLISFEPEISHLMIIMCLSYMIGVIKGGVKYR